MIKTYFSTKLFCGLKYDLNTSICTINLLKYKLKLVKFKFKSVNVNFGHYPKGTAVQLPALISIWLFIYLEQ